ncbi:MAG: hypothetical protein KBS98_00690 [Flavobacterium sp.]|nr:hypothetical protein [Candidatus Neoflavobacterium equi]
MKTILIPCFLFLSLLGCKSSQETKENLSETTTKTKRVIKDLPQITYSEKTRGFSYVIQVKDVDVLIERRGVNGEETRTLKLSTDQLKKLKESYADIEIENINDFVSEETKRFSDASRIASIQFQTADQLYISNDFDSGNAPQELKNIVSLVSALDTKK